MPFSKYFSQIRGEVEAELEKLTPGADTFPPVIHEAMRYSLFAGGKRLRPMLAVAAFDVVAAKRAAVMPFAVALEMIHTYTLIHDDLPALDDDDLRRGIPTSHIKFGEANAVLAGDALLTLAFEILTDWELNPDEPAGTLLKVARETATAIGSMGTIGGQVVDMEYENAEEPDMAALEYIHTHKTGKLITASVRGGAMLGGADEDELAAITDYGKHIGLAFQIVDDILDIEGDEKELGKTIGSDLAKDKMTYPAAAGMNQSKKRAAELTDKAIEALEMFGDKGEHLADLAKYIIARTF